MDRPCINCQKYFDIREHYGKCPECNFDNFTQSTCTENVSIKTKKINMKNFKNGQKVKHPKYGEGEITFTKDVNGYWVDFNDISRAWSEKGDDFYNQLEAVEDLPEVGEYAYFWDDGWDYSVFARYNGKSKDKHIMVNKKGILVDYQYISKTPPKFD